MPSAHFIPYIKSTWNKINAMITLANAKPGDRMADLGSGDGRIVMEFGKLGVESHGFEIDSLLVSESRLNIQNKNLEHLVKIHEADFWSENLSKFDIITIYGMPDVLSKLENKLIQELKGEARIISSIYEFPNWKYSAKKDNVYLYAFPEFTGL